MRAFVAIILLFAVLSAHGQAIESITLTQNATNTTPHTINLPATVASGDLLICGEVLDGERTPTWDNTTAGTWAEDINVNGGAGSNTMIISTKIADGTEDGAALSIAIGGNEEGVGFCIRFLAAQWFGDLAGVYFGTPATGQSVNPDPPSVAPGIGTQTFRAIALAAVNHDIGGDSPVLSVHSYPDNQTYQFAANDTNSQTLALSTDELSVASDDPGAMTIDSAEFWIAETILVRAPASGSAVPLIHGHNQQQAQQ